MSLQYHCFVTVRGNAVPLCFTPWNRTDLLFLLFAKMITGHFIQSITEFHNNKYNLKQMKIITCCSFINNKCYSRHVAMRKQQTLKW